MQTNQDLCGCGGPGRPLYELKHLVALLERQEEERKRREAERNPTPREPQQCAK
jgi:hypothetical protein